MVPEERERRIDGRLRRPKCFFITALYRSPRLVTIDCRNAGDVQAGRIYRLPRPHDNHHEQRSTPSLQGLGPV